MQALREVQERPGQNVGEDQIEWLVCIGESGFGSVSGVQRYVARNPVFETIFAGDCYRDRIDIDCRDAALIMRRFYRRDCEHRRPSPEIQCGARGERRNHAINGGETSARRSMMRRAESAPGIDLDSPMRMDGAAIMASMNEKAASADGRQTLLRERYPIGLGECLDRWRRQERNAR